MAETIDWKGPPPPKGKPKGNKSPFPFKNWEVGDTKRYPLTKYDKIRNAVQNLNRAAKAKGETAYWRYAKVLEDGRTFVRVWRVS